MILIKLRVTTVGNIEGLRYLNFRYESIFHTRGIFNLLHSIICCGLLADSLCSSDYVASNGRIINEWRIGNNTEKAAVASFIVTCPGFPN
jgi:hypothetical protein